MKKLEILLFDEQLEMLKDFKNGEFDIHERAGEVCEFLETLSKIAFDDEYYEKYKEYNNSLFLDVPSMPYPK